MEKLLKFLKNRWFLFVISLLSPIYVVFVGKIALRMFDSYLEPENFGAMMVAYVFVNFIFGVLMFFTRKQIPTILTALLVPFESLFLMIFGFGEWHIVVPPIVVSAVIFLACGVGESCKTVMGTLFLIMYVAGGLAYSVMASFFGITVRFVATDLFTDQSQEIDFSTRNNNYLVTDDGRYRIVLYEEERDDRKVTNYYVEEAYKDTEYPFAVFRRTFGCRRILVTAYERDIDPHWLDNERLMIDGVTMTVEEIFAPRNEEEPEETTVAETTKRPSRTTAAETTVPEESDEGAEEETEPQDE